MRLFCTQSHALVLVTVALAAGLFFGGHLIVLFLERIAGLQQLAADEMLSHPAVVFLVIAYVVLLAIPFVPGAELGFFLLLLFGADIAPIVYGATIIGMTLAYTVGTLIPSDKLLSRFPGLGLNGFHNLARKCDDEIGNRKPVGRWLCLCLRHRCAALAIIVNTPGNTILGGGGGIALAAGLSRLYKPTHFLATVAVAVAPVPITFLVLF